LVTRPLRFVTPTVPVPFESINSVDVYEHHMFGGHLVRTQVVLRGATDIVFQTSFDDRFETMQLGHRLAKMMNVPRVVHWSTGHATTVPAT
jgi:hypothetical protein